MTETATSVVAKALENVEMGGVLNEYLALLPIMIPIAITFIAARKGVSFVLGTLRNA